MTEDVLERLRFLSSSDANTMPYPDRLAELVKISKEAVKRIELLEWKVDHLQNSIDQLRFQD